MKPTACCVRENEPQPHSRSISNTTPYKRAKRIRKLGTIEDARCELWRATVRVKEVLNDEEAAPELTLKSAHCMQQCVNSYVQLLEASDLEKRIEALEQAQNTVLRKVAWKQLTSRVKRLEGDIDFRNPP